MTEDEFVGRRAAKHPQVNQPTVNRLTAAHAERVNRWLHDEITPGRAANAWRRVLGGALERTGRRSTLIRAHRPAVVPMGCLQERPGTCLAPRALYEALRRLRTALCLDRDRRIGPPKDRTTLQSYK